MYKRERSKDSWQVFSREELCCNKSLFVFHVLLAWAAYLKSRPNIQMKLRIGPLPPDKEMPERGAAHAGAHRMLSWQAYGRNLPGFPGLLVGSQAALSPKENGRA